MDGKTILRCIIIPDINMNEAHINRLAKIFGKLKHSQYIELLPYHPYGSSKAEQIGESNIITFRKPKENEILEFAEALQKKGAIVKCMGSFMRTK